MPSFAHLADVQLATVTKGLPDSCVPVSQDAIAENRNNYRSAT